LLDWQGAEQCRVSGLTVFKPTHFGWCVAWQLGLDDKLLRTARGLAEGKGDQWETLHKYVICARPCGHTSFFLVRTK
jgi:hypothetical protein